MAEMRQFNVITSKYFLEVSLHRAWVLRYEDVANRIESCNFCLTQECECIHELPTEQSSLPFLQLTELNSIPFGSIIIN
jgi:hypothetical protein